MTKTFKNRVSVRDAESVLEITDTPAGIRLTVREEYGIVHGWFAPKQGAEIALAILEAAGVAESSDAGVSAQYLRAHIAEQERITAEAKLQAELEAEALELYNVCMTGHNLTSFDGLGGALRDQWLAVARKARELGGRAEK